MKKKKEKFIETILAFLINIRFVLNCFWRSSRSNRRELEVERPVHCPTTHKEWSETQCDKEYWTQTWRFASFEFLVPWPSPTSVTLSYQYEDSTSMQKYLQTRGRFSHVSTTASQHGANKIKFRFPFQDWLHQSNRNQESRLMGFVITVTWKAWWILL